MNRLIHTVCLFLLAAVITSCGASAPVRYYSLESTNVASAPSAPGSAVIGLGPLRVPEYLKRTQMVTRGSGAELNVDEYVRWAEPVGEAMHRIVASNLDARLPDAVVLTFPYLESLLVDYHVLGQVDRFDADATGLVTLSVQWAVLDQDHQAVIAPQRSAYESRASTAGDPNAIAAAMNVALDQFSVDIADQLRAALASSEPNAVE
jgi:uncharacterized lipoprotein YmbA